MLVSSWWLTCRCERDPLPWQEENAVTRSVLIANATAIKCACSHFRWQNSRTCTRIWSWWSIQKKKEKKNEIVLFREKENVSILSSERKRTTTTTKARYNHSSIMYERRVTPWFSIIVNLWNNNHWSIKSFNWTIFFLHRERRQCMSMFFVNIQMCLSIGQMIVNRKSTRQSFIR